MVCSVIIISIEKFGYQICANVYKISFFISNICNEENRFIIYFSNIKKLFLMLLYFSLSFVDNATKQISICCHILTKFLILKLTLCSRK